MKATKEKVFFEIDSYDFHEVDKEIAKSSDFIWKTNLLGGGRIFHILERFATMRTIKKYLDHKKMKDNWEYSEGYKIGKIGAKNEAEFITNKETLPTSSFNENGIHSTINQKKELMTFFENFKTNNSLYRFYIATSSNRFMIGRATSLLKQDIDNLPYPENPDDLKLAHWEEIFKEDVLNYYLKFKSEGENSAIMKIASRKQLNEYSRVFADTLNSVYEFGNGNLCLPLFLLWN